jgi:hypothetical protein
MREIAARPPRNREATRLAWADRLARHPDSGLSVAAFCASEGVSANSFFYWKRQLSSIRSSEVQPRLLPVRLLASPPPVEVVLPCGTVLRLAPGCDLSFVRSLVDALGRESC